MIIDKHEKLSSLIKEHFPCIDKEIYNYMYCVLVEGQNDLHAAEDIYDCLGELMSDILREFPKTHVMQLCAEFLETLSSDRPKKQEEDETGRKKLLQGPVHLGNMFSSEENEISNYKSIWVVQKELQSQVNKKKLSKAEAKLKAKAEKRENAEQKTVDPALWQKEASTSQMISKAVANADENSRTKDIKIEKFDISFGNKKLLEEADLTMTYGRRYGLVGRNGIGKSTLLKMISNGSLVIPKHISILHVEQEVVGNETTALESVLESDTVRNSLLVEEKELSLKAQEDEKAAERLQEVFAKLNEIEADKAPARASQILSGLGFSREWQERATKTFSGGWRMRIALARALFSRPDLLLLDEPTNMLDMKAIMWLQTYLVTNWSSILLVVSHDRSFLNHIATDVIHFHGRKLDAYKGNYDNFDRAKIERLKNQEREYEAQLAFRKHVQEFIDKFRFNAKRASLVQSKIKMLEKLPVLTPVVKESKVVLKFADTEPLAGAPILQLDEVTFRYSPDSPIILEKISVNSVLTSRICIVGENGSGKTTLLKLLNGFLEPTSGLRLQHRNLNIGYFSQHHVDQLTLNQTPIEFLATKYPGKPAEHYRGYLGRFGITGELGTQPIMSLSGGQKSRVAFAAMALGNPSLLILDEPTNHLDVETVEALGEAIHKFKGGVILVSHDQQLLEMVCTELWLVKNKGVQTIKGGFEEYKRIVTSELKDI